MKVYLDGDSCPRTVREFAAKSCQRYGIPLFCVANRPIPFDQPESVILQVVGSEEGAADDALTEQVLPGDLVLTRDIPLAARLVERGVVVINDRGTIYTRENVRERLSVRNFMADLRASGLQADTTGVWGKKEWEAFVRAWDKVFHRLLKATTGVAKDDKAQKVPAVPTGLDPEPPRE